MARRGGPRLPDLPDVSAGIAEEIAAGTVTVAERAGQPVGAIIVHVSGSRAHLVNVATDPGERGRGTVRALIDHALRAARAEGAQVIALATHVAMPENVTLYTRLGWQEMGREGKRVLMERAL